MNPAPATVKPNGPGAAYVSVVQSVLQNEPLFKGKLGPVDAEVPRRDGQVLKFHRVAYTASVKLHADGINVIMSTKTTNATILEAGRLVIDGGPAEPAAAPVVVAPAAAAPVTTAPVVPAPTPATVVAAPAAVVEVVAPVKATPAVREKEKPKVDKAKAGVDVNLALSIYSLVQSAIFVAEHDRSPGAAERAATLTTAADAYRSAIAG